MSDSSFRLTPSSRRQNVGRRVSRPVQPGQNQPKVAKKPQPGRAKVKPAVKPVKPTAKSTVPTTAVSVSRKSIVKSTVKPVKVSGINTQIPPYNPKTAKVKSVRVRKQPIPRKTVVARRTRLKPMARNILYGLRLLIVGVGIGAIVGTVLSVLDPATRLNSTSTPTPTTQPTAQQTQTPTTSDTLQLSQEISNLKSSIQNIAALNPNLTPGVFLVDLDNGSYVDFNGGAMFASASTIKIPILIAFFQDVDAGKISIEETLTTSKSTIVGGSGDMQNRPVGTKYAILEVAEKMITISDNTATNMLIERMGGAEKLNQRFRDWGLSTTSLRNILPDIQGTNTTSPKELGSLIAMITKGNIVSPQSRTRILDIMRRTVKDTLLPSGLGQGATIAHKTGEIGALLADAGLVELPSGKRYIAAVMVQRPRNDASAEKLITNISRATYQQFAQVGSAPVNSVNPPVNPPVNPSFGNTVPVNPIQAPVITQPLPNTLPNTYPNTNYNPIPSTGYQPPLMNPMPNSTYVTPPMPNMGSSVPSTSYQAPGVNQQYYYPYQR